MGLARRIVVVGGSLAALKAARRLAADRRFAVSIVVPQKTELLMRILEKSSITLREGSLRDVNHADHRAVLTDGAEFSYDELIITGEEPPLDAGSDSYALIGASPAAVEFAGMRAEHGAHVDIIENAPRLLPELPERFAGLIKGRLEQLGATVYTSTSTGRAQQTLPHGTKKDHVLIQADDFKPMWPKTLHPPDDHCRAQDSIWAAGAGGGSAIVRDQRAVNDVEHIADCLIATAEGKPLPAQSRAPVVTIIRVGSRWAAVTARGLQIYGWLGWLAWCWVQLNLVRRCVPLRLVPAVWTARISSATSVF